MRVKHLVPISLLVFFISLMPSLSHALSIEIDDTDTTGLVTQLYFSDMLTVNNGTSGYISLANVGTVGGLTVGTCANCAGPARVSFLDGATVDKMWLTDVAFTATSQEALTGISITITQDFLPSTSSSYPTGATLNETFAAGNTATLTMTFCDNPDGCSSMKTDTRTVTDPMTGGTFNVTSQGSLPGPLPDPRIQGDTHLRSVPLVKQFDSPVVWKDS